MVEPTLIVKFVSLILLLPLSRRLLPQRPGLRRRLILLLLLPLSFSSHHPTLPAPPADVVGDRFTAGPGVRADIHNGCRSPALTRPRRRASFKSLSAAQEKGPTSHIDTSNFNYLPLSYTSPSLHALPP